MHVRCPKSYLFWNGKEHVLSKCESDIRFKLVFLPPDCTQIPFNSTSHLSTRAPRPFDSSELDLICKVGYIYRAIRLCMSFSIVEYEMEFLII